MFEKKECVILIDLLYMEKFETQIEVGREGFETEEQKNKLEIINKTINKLEIIISNI